MKTIVDKGWKEGEEGGEKGKSGAALLRVILLGA
jgi:hypothetical protein